MKENKSLRLNNHYRHVCLDLVIASLAKNTWQRYDSAYRMWERFCKDNELKVDIKNFGQNKRTFILWCWEKSHLAVSTVRTYLGSLKRVKNLADGLSRDEGDLEGILLKGMENLTIGKAKKSGETVPVTPDTLKLIRKGLCREKEKLTGQTIWTCCLVAFWGAFRLSELLGKTEDSFDKFSDLLWENIVLEGDKVTIHVKSPKTGGVLGSKATLFEIPEPSFCPVGALKRLKASQLNMGMGEPSLPVFRKSGGLALTKRVFLDTVNGLLDGKTANLTGKSFRTGLPSALENFPEIFRESHLKALGRWKGRSYQLYMKNDTPEFRWVFNLVAKTILNKNFTQENWKDGPSTSTGFWMGQKGKLLPTRKKTPTRRRIRRRGKTTETPGGS